MCIYSDLPFTLRYELKYQSYQFGLSVGLLMAGMLSNMIKPELSEFYLSNVYDFVYKLQEIQ